MDISPGSSLTLPAQDHHAPDAAVSDVKVAAAAMAILMIEQRLAMLVSLGWRHVWQVDRLANPRQCCVAAHALLAHQVKQR
ncbi:MAG: hypothetical protein P8P56_01395 [Yoonia sp.]|nr:hypothetical protein [Yoonia sp.]